MRARTKLTRFLIIIGIVSTMLRWMNYSQWTQSTDRRMERKQIDQLEVLKATLHGRVNTLNTSLEDGIVMTDTKRPSHQPFESPDNCSKYVTRFGRALPRVWLLSFPCSGNTWIRHLLDGATGLFTGSIYNDHALFQKGFLGEKENINSGTTVVQKTHMQDNKDDMLVPAVLLIRNPAKSIISFWKFKNTKFFGNKHTSQIQESLFTTKEFHSHVTSSINMWERLTVDRLLSSQAPLHVLYYERLVEDTDTYLRQTLHFLGVPVDEARMSCLLDNSEGKFHRKGNKPLDPYSPKEKMAMDVAAGRVNRTLVMLGYPPLPTY